jgi:hypothetical protein
MALSSREQAGVQARHCLDKGAHEAWQIGNDPSPINPEVAVYCRQTTFLRPPNSDSSIVAPLRVFDGANPILALRAIL